MHRKTLAAILAAAAVTGGAAAAETVEVKMLNRGPDGETMVYDPPVVQIEPGDTVRFVAEDRGHNAQSIDGAIPEGAESFRGGINETIEVTFDVEGTYAYKCLPHTALGMVGLVLVGDHSGNFDEATGIDLPGRKAEERLSEYAASVE